MELARSVTNKDMKDLAVQVFKTDDFESEPEETDSSYQSDSSMSELSGEQTTRRKRKKRPLVLNDFYFLRQIKHLDQKLLSVEELQI